jgi:hypothetical protein
LEGNGIRYLDDLKRLIIKKFNTLSKYTDEIISFRKENETDTLKSYISIDSLYNIGILEVIVYKENGMCAMVGFEYFKN